MDWHYVDIIKEFYDENIPTSNLQYYDGWTGYSWNTHLFKDYKEFLKTLKNENLKVTLNLHPAQGVRKYEAMFNEFAKSMNVDPCSTNIIEFDISNEQFIKSYFEVLHHPYEKDGVDFWWIDWQQGTSSKVKNLDPLWALNHYHYLDNDKANTRPMILSRYSGPGSHRYPLGFSGDTHMTWESLDFQPYFTNCATNIGYVWWSHDIGGHCCGYKDNELYIRWLQYGVFSPINRLHSTNDPFTGKEPWKLPSQYKDIAINYLQLRKRLIPYLYSMNYQTYKNNIALIRPLYYMINNELAYKFKNEYFFGSELLVSPITSKSNKTTCLSKAKTYIPEGRWTDIFTNQIYNTEQVLTLYRDISYIPVLAKQGAIIPLYVDYQSNNIDNNQDLEVLIYRGNNSFKLYEDINRAD
jgi:alpha-glucosidase (family GH31 glycosyl hydrolase)